MKLGKSFVTYFKDREQAKIVDEIYGKKITVDEIHSFETTDEETGEPSRKVVFTVAEAGGNVALGLWNGILEGLGNIAKWLYDNVIYPFIDGFKNGMGIHSPSTVMFELRKICNARAFEPE